MKTFSLHWGSGVVEEEAQIETPYHRPTIQVFWTIVFAVTWAAPPSIS